MSLSVNGERGSRKEAHALRTRQRTFDEQWTGSLPARSRASWEKNFWRCKQALSRL